MQNREFNTRTETKPSLTRQVVERQKDEHKARGARLPQRDPFEPLISGIGDASSAGVHASMLNRATDRQPFRAGQSLLRLQKQYGNRYVQKVLALAGKGTGEAEAAPDVEQSIQQARGGGHGIDSRVRGQMESAFGADFGNVRLHTDTQADTLNRELNARAFTTGQDIFFRQEAYNPGSSSGRELIAHELTHVVQQNGDKVQRKLTLGQPGDKYEQEADQMARAVMQQEQQVVQKQSDGKLVRRQVEEEEEEVQMKSEYSRVQRQVEEEEEEEEEPVQPKVEDAWIQQQTEEKEEELIQPKTEDSLVQRQIEEEEEEIQAFSESIHHFLEPRVSNNSSENARNLSSPYGKVILQQEETRKVKFAGTGGSENPIQSKPKIRLPHQTYFGQETQIRLLRGGGQFHLQLARRSKKALKDKAKDAALRLQRLLQKKKAAELKIRRILLPRDVRDDMAWLKHVEKEYNSLFDRIPHESGGVTKWIQAERPVIGLPRRNEGEPIVAFVVESPLREHLKKRMGGEVASDLIHKLELATRTKPLLKEERFERIWKPRAEKILSSDERKFAIEAAKKANKTWTSGLSIYELAKWLFHDKVWSWLCRGKNIEYVGEAMMVVRVKLFRQPTVDQKKNWHTVGAVAYLQDIAFRLNKQIGYLHQDIGYLNFPSALLGMNAEAAIKRIKSSILKYQKAWEEIGEETGTMAKIKNKILAPKSKYMKYLWSEDERRKLKAWGWKEKKKG